MRIDMFKTRAGMTFIEMIVAISIFAMGMIGFTLLFTNAWSQNQYIIEEGEASYIASRAVHLIVDDLRMARQGDNGSYLIDSADDSDLKVYVDNDNDGVTERLHFYLDGTDLKMGVTEPTGNPSNYPSADQETYLLAHSIINGADPIFYYYNEDFPGDDVNNPLSGTIDVADVRMVKVHLKVNIDPFKIPDHINIESFAQLRNIASY